MKVVLFVAGTVILVFCVVVNPALFGVLIPFALIAGALFAPMFLCRDRAAEESGRVPLFEAICNGRFGWLYRTNIRSIRLSVYNDFLVVALFAPTVVPFADIKGANVLFGRLLLLQTTARSYRLYVKSADEVLRLLHRA